MMIRGKVVRWFDILGLLGVVLLLAVVPGYLAEGLVRPEATEPAIFTLPPARPGDTYTLDLVASYQDGPAERLGTFVEISFRAAEEGDFPGTALVDERHYPELEVTTPYLSFRSHGVTTRSHYDAEGVLLWEAIDVGDPGDEASLRLGLRPGSEGNALQPWSKNRIVYSPDLTEPIPASIAAGFAHGLRSEEDQRHPATIADSVAEYEGNRVYGSSRGIILTTWDKEVETPFKELRGRTMFTDADAGVPLPIPRHGIDLMMSEEAVRHIFSAEEIGNNVHNMHVPAEVWHWFHPDAAVPLGAHVRFDDRDGDHLLTVDVVPREVEEGSGPGLTVPPGKRVTAGTRTLSESVPTSAPDDTITIEAFHRDPRPILANVSAALLVSLLSGPEAPAETRAALEAGARIVGIYGAPLPPGTETQDEVGPLPVGPPEGDDGPVRVERTAWLVALARADGSLTVDQLTVEEWMTGPRAVAHGSACAGAAPPFEDVATDCSAVARDLVAPSRVLADPLVVRSDAAQAAPDRSRFAFLPVFEARLDPTSIRKTYDLAGPLQPNELRHSLSQTYHPPVDRSTFQNRESRWGGPAAEPPAGIILFGASSAGALQVFDARDGAPLLIMFGEQQEDPVVLSVQGEAAPARFASHTGLSRIGGGIGLLVVLVALVARLGVALKAGAHYPLIVWLYAKIPRHAVLTNPRRTAIMDLLQAEPGITMSAVARRLGYGWGATVHHLHRLEANGLAVHFSRGRTLHWYAAGALDKGELPLYAALQDPEQARILDLVSTRPVSAGELALALGRSRSRASRLANRLVALGLVEKQRTGRTIRFARAASASPPAQHESVERDGVVA